MKKPKLNLKLLRKIQKHILAEPARFVMWTWFLRRADTTSSYTPDGGNDRVKFPDCGTAACIGGWACILSGASLAGDIHTRARNLLGLTLDEGRDLFSENRWPLELRAQLMDGKTPLARAKAGAAAIERFIKERAA